LLIKEIKPTIYELLGENAFKSLIQKAYEKYKKDDIEKEIYVIMVFEAYLSYRDRLV
jgi:hypothetical protein